MFSSNAGRSLFAGCLADWLRWLAGLLACYLLVWPGMFAALLSRWLAGLLCWLASEKAIQLKEVSVLHSEINVCGVCDVFYSNFSRRTDPTIAACAVSIQSVISLLSYSFIWGDILFFLTTHAWLKKICHLLHGTTLAVPSKIT